MSCSDDTEPHGQPAPHRAVPHAVLALEAGVPFQQDRGCAPGVDPIAEWLDLMEVVQMLCPVWPVRDKPMQGNHWRL